MHYLDSKIIEIEREIHIIYKALDKGAGDIESSLTGIGFINLDSLIAWRTLRFLLRTAKIEKETSKKWIETPSSYRYKFLNPVWKFADKNIDDYSKKYTKTKLNVQEKLKFIIDDYISFKRNSIAHFNEKEERPTHTSNNDTEQQNTPKEYQKLKVYFDLFTQIFGRIELVTFLEEINNKLISKYPTIFKENKAHVIMWKYDKNERDMFVISPLNKIYEQLKFEGSDETTNIFELDFMGITLSYPLTEETFDNTAPNFTIEFNANNESGYGIRCHEDHPERHIYDEKHDDTYRNKWWVYWRDLKNENSSFYDIWKSSKKYYRNIDHLVNQIKISL